jgi:hypothetical protein
MIRVSKITGAVQQRPARLHPLVRNHRWRLTTSHFRRTLAWFIARRPGGVIAGAIQYRHQKIQMFEGYAKAREFHQTGEVSAGRLLGAAFE